MPMGWDVRSMTAEQLAAAFVDRTLGPVEVARELLVAITEYDGTVNSFCLVDEAVTLAAAEASQERYRRGEPLGRLDGVPERIKDLLLTAGWPTLRGSRLIAADSDPWTVDAPAVARLREVGAVPIGKTTTPEFGWKGVTDGPLTGITRNPRALDRTAGGSSGGSAAAVAAAFTPLALGTDGGGSIRIPAAFCGIVGLKPTFGRVPAYPASPFGTLAHVGPMARTVRDCAALLDAISGFDSRDWWSAPRPTESALDALDAQAAPGDLRGTRIAYSPNLGYGSNDPAVQRNTDAAVEVLIELGATVTVVDLDWSDPVDAYHVLWFAGAAAVVDGYGPGAAERIDPGLAAALGRHHGFSAADYLEATAVRMRLGTEMGALHEEFDVLVTPAMPTVAFEAGVDVPERLAGSEWTSWSPYTYPFNLTGQPAISIPDGTGADGLPTGLQIVGARHRDHTVLRVAAAYEAATGAGQEVVGEEVVAEGIS